MFFSCTSFYHFKGRYAHFTPFYIALYLLVLQVLILYPKCCYLVQLDKKRRIQNIH